MCFLFADITQLKALDEGGGGGGPNVTMSHVIVARYITQSLVTNQK